jgi:hypothetical protein
MRFEMRNAGAVDQHEIHHRRRDEGEPPPRIARTEGKERKCQPDEPLEEIIWMARPAPEADIADATTMGGVGLEALQLAIGGALAENAERQHEGTGEIDRARLDRRIARGDQYREHQQCRRHRLDFEKPE